ncbi:class I SAM-dependent methyltransferase [Polyangium spumosum]|uniref:Methyltransferase domain-containing protein n=1 Tax=Polyangium spumosum TaxID=889282 RepID=A0A6N7PN95_9BACT|nr:class I SAM-dependent methyltransferase [Polyangium spumosum]MRG93543.1 methyltransferase domain-containing protein [Polyangium spumosum]
MRLHPLLVILALPLLAGCGGASATQPAPKTAEPAGGAHAHGGHHGHHGHHGHGGPLVHRFEKAEDWAKEFDDPARDAWQKPDEVVAALRLSPGMTVADLGAGTGYFEPHLARGVGPSGKVLALDVEADMVRYLRERAAKEKLDNVEARQVGLADPGLGQGTVDRVLIVDVWHHIDGRKDYAAKVRDGLKPGGLLVIVDFTMEATKGPPKEHRITPEAMIAELASAGLEAEVVPETLPDQYIVVAKKP